MKNLMLAVAAATIVTAAATVPAGISGGARQDSHESMALVLVGPVEAVNVSQGLAIVLGQKVITQSAAELSVGEAISVIGRLSPDGSILAMSVQKAGVYVPGATQILLTGTVQKVDSTIGRAVVGGLSVDLTGLMSTGSVPIVQGSTVQIAGTQPVNRGLVLVTGISGGALTQGISGGALTQGISGGALTQGISGGALTQGISGGAKLQGISGGAKVAGISGGALTQGISGGAKLQGISGGAKLQGISGGALTQGISGGAL